jgi:hypothetical protein
MATSSDLTLGHPPRPEYPRVGCPEIFVYIVMVAEGAPPRSAALLGVGEQGPARFRRPGERIGDWTVLAISDDWTGLNPDVWLEKDGAVCRAELEGNPSRIHPAPKPPPSPRRDGVAAERQTAMVAVTLSPRVAVSFAAAHARGAGEPRGCECIRLRATSPTPSSESGR